MAYLVWSYFIKLKCMLYILDHLFQPHEDWPRQTSFHLQTHIKKSLIRYGTKVVSILLNIKQRKESPWEPEQTGNLNPGVLVMRELGDQQDVLADAESFLSTSLGLFKVLLLISNGQDLHLGNSKLSLPTTLEGCSDFTWHIGKARE